MNIISSPVPKILLIIWDQVLGQENKSFEKEEEIEFEEGDQLGDDFNLILDKKLLETITENQNSPYSTQASHNPSRRMSAQSLFDSTRRYNFGLIHQMT